MYCRFCGQMIRDESKFCPYCGAHIANNANNSNNANHKEQVLRKGLLRVVAMKHHHKRVRIDVYVDGRRAGFVKTKGETAVFLDEGLHTVQLIVEIMWLGRHFYTRYRRITEQVKITPCTDTVLQYSEKSLANKWQEINIIEKEWPSINDPCPACGGTMMVATVQKKKRDVTYAVCKECGRCVPLQ